MASESDEITYYRLYVSDAALRDIEAIYAFLLENADELAAAKQGSVIFARIEKLKVFPNGYPICELFPSLRMAYAGKYLILFRVDDKSKSVNVVRIFHTHQNIDGEI